MEDLWLTSHVTDMVGNVFVPDVISSCDHAFLGLGEDVDFGLTGRNYLLDVAPDALTTKHLYFDVPTDALGFTLVVFGRGVSPSSTNLGL